MIEVGKLYRCQEYYLLLYPNPAIHAAAEADVGRVTTKRAAVGSHVRAGAESSAFGMAENWSNMFKCVISYIKPNEIFMVVDQQKIDNRQYVKILCAGRKMGWIVWEDWMNIELVK